MTGHLSLTTLRIAQFNSKINLGQCVGLEMVGEDIFYTKMIPVRTETHNIFQMKYSVSTSIWYIDNFENQNFKLVNGKR